ncbi:MAG: hypothetical protein IJI49_04970 [Bacilli bacterium]|nr:hypothetical protein [Bacilli bacterium]
MNNKEIIQGLVNFTAVSIVFLIVLLIIFSIFLKKFKFNKKNIEIYGLFLNLDTISLISISSLTINYLFLVWCTLSFQGLNIIYVSFTIILVFLSDAVSDNFNNLPKSLGLTVVNCAAIQITYLIYNHLMTEKFSYLLAIILGLVVLFVFLYYTYNLLRQINNIAVKQKYQKEKKYKKYKI